MQCGNRGKKALEVKREFKGEKILETQSVCPLASLLAMHGLIFTATRLKLCIRV